MVLTVMAEGIFDDWHSVLEPVVARYGDANIRRFFRGDAGFANFGI